MNGRMISWTLHWLVWCLRLGSLAVASWVVLLMCETLYDGTISGIIRSKLNWVSSRLTERRKTSSEGSTTQLSMSMVLIYGMVLAVVPATIALAKYYSRFPVYELHNVEVLSTPKPLEYWMRFTSPTEGRLEFYARFCPDYEPGFDAGDFLTILTYEDRRSCWGLSRPETGYIIRRDHDGRTDSEQHVRP